MSFTTDNRWSAGSLQDKVPETALAAYGARWIDHDTSIDVVPDRQGFAYNDILERDRLLNLMEVCNLRTRATQLPRSDDPVEVIASNGFEAWMRRTGGYVYVAAWITP